MFTLIFIGATSSKFLDISKDDTDSKDDYSDDWKPDISNSMSNESLDNFEFEKFNLDSRSSSPLPAGSKHKLVKPIPKQEPKRKKLREEINEY